MKFGNLIHVVVVYLTNRVAFIIFTFSIFFDFID